VNAWGITDKGVARSQNQDSFYVNVFHDDQYAICVVCDGMGGARSGNVASDLAVRTFLDELLLAVRPSMSPKYMRSILERAVYNANRAVFHKSQTGPEYYGMGTTLTGMVLIPGHAIIANVGDSRAYLLEPGDTARITQVTQDHSVVEDMLRRGEISTEQARVHPRRNLLTRVIGTEIEVECDIFGIDIKRGDRLLLCSDGLTCVVEEQEILFETMGEGLNPPQPAAACQRLVEIANLRGGPDNITVIIAGM
jgi:protein phosphatase